MARRSSRICVIVIPLGVLALGLGRSGPVAGTLDEGSELGVALGLAAVGGDALGVGDVPVADEAKPSVPVSPATSPVELTAMMTAPTDSTLPVAMSPL